MNRGAPTLTSVPTAAVRSKTKPAIGATIAAPARPASAFVTASRRRATSASAPSSCACARVRAPRAATSALRLGARLAERASNLWRFACALASALWRGASCRSAAARALFARARASSTEDGASVPHVSPFSTCAPTSQESVATTPAAGALIGVCATGAITPLTTTVRPADASSRVRLTRV